MPSDYRQPNSITREHTSYLGLPWGVRQKKNKAELRGSCINELLLTLHVRTEQRQQCLCSRSRSLLQSILPASKNSCRKPIIHSSGDLAQHSYHKSIWSCCGHLPLFPSERSPDHIKKNQKNNKQQQGKINPYHNSLLCSNSLTISQEGWCYFSRHTLSSVFHDCY